MKFRILGLLITCLLISDIQAGWFSRSKGSSKGTGSKQKQTSSTSSTGHSSSHFLNNERGHSGGHTSQDHHQQSSRPAQTHSESPYKQQPAYNPSYTQHQPQHASAPNQPYVPSGGHGSHGFVAPPLPGSHSQPASAPYPVHAPNHPLPPTSNNHGSHSIYPPLPNNQPYHPSQQSYHPPSQSSHYPSNIPPFPGGSGHAPAPYQPYHPPSQSHYPQHAPPSGPYIPGQPQTVHVIHSNADSGYRRGGSSGGSGIGTAIATGVAGGVAAGATNAIVDHAISSIFRSSPSNTHTYPSAPPVGTPTTVTHITNNYYGEPNQQPGANPQFGAGQPPVVAGSSSPVQSAAPVSAQAPQGSPSTDSNVKAYPASTSNGVLSKTPEAQPEIPPANAGPVISDENLMKFTEELFDKQDRDLNQYIELNLQKKVSGNNPSETVPDEAPEPLFKLKPELDSVSTVRTLRALYDNYQRDGSKKEDLTPERRNEENAFLDEIVKTPVMSRALNWLVQEKFVEADEYEQKEVLKRMWFSHFDGTSSGFERIFLSEKFGDNGIVGMQNWIYFAHLESQQNVNYLGYVDMLNLNGKGALLKMNYQTEGITNKNATIFTGTPPELEMAIYTVCFYARPNNWCPVSLGGTKFFVLTHSFRSFGKDLIDLGFPAFS
ncbi:hypothetical protein QAD02_009670 [Eretmocerus hayati]|uniref:Uncharacterized protein n=1 Tax=Eretmocerus hayati TaxID=131215 RepID=A0ACC2NCC2_9HYME|nr:hypothetical protein QAD02_009670 [Eretmocerus hayati]